MTKDRQPAEDQKKNSPSKRTPEQASEQLYGMFIAGEPDWSVWRNIPHVTVQEAVALSMGVSPTYTRFPDPETAKRLLMTSRNVGVAFEWIPGTNRIPLKEFAKWALSMNWEVSSGFTELAGPAIGGGEDYPTKQKNPALDRELGSRERSSLLGIIAVLAREQKIDLSHPSKAATVIENLTINNETRVAARTIQNYLKLIPDAEERLRKS